MQEPSGKSCLAHFPYEKWGSPLDCWHKFTAAQYEEYSLVTTMHISCQTVSPSYISKICQDVLNMTLMFTENTLKWWVLSWEQHERTEPRRRNWVGLSIRSTKSNQMHADSVLVVPETKLTISLWLPSQHPSRLLSPVFNLFNWERVCLKFNSIPKWSRNKPQKTNKQTTTTTKNVDEDPASRPFFPIAFIFLPSFDAHFIVSLSHGIVLFTDLNILFSQ